MFTPEAREAARALILRLASSDSRITAGAVVGSFARGTDDPWSDLDLTFAVDDQGPIGAVIDDWTRQLGTFLDAMPVWDTHVGQRTYRIFLLPGLLQVDLSFMPASQFAPAGPAFELLFGEAGSTDLQDPRAAEQYFGLGVVQAVHARRCLERGRYWQAGQAIGVVRECSLSLACLRAGLDPEHGRGFDDLPPATLELAAESLVVSIRPDDLEPALECAIDLLREEGAHVAYIKDLAGRLGDDLRLLASYPR